MTQQARDYIYLSGRKYALNGDPFSPYIRSCENPFRFKAVSSICWKGYSTVWFVKEKKLYLKEIRGTIGTGWMTEEQMMAKTKRSRLLGFLNGYSKTQNFESDLDLECVYDQNIQKLKYKYDVCPETKNRLDDEILKSVNLQDVFNNDGSPVFACWFTGAIELDDEVEIEDEPEVGKDYIFLEFIDGILTNSYTRYLTNQEKLDSTLEEFIRLRKKSK